MVFLATAGYLLGMGKRFGSRTVIVDTLLDHRSKAARALMAGGLGLVLVGFVQGSYYAGFDLYRQESADYNILSSMSSAAAAQRVSALGLDLEAYGQLQADKAVKIAAHAHFIEFGVLAMILAFFQPYVRLSEIWKHRWIGVFLAGSALLPLCVLLELRYGLIAGGVADFGGLLVIVALLAMWIGILRYTGVLDAVGERA
jgi:hypothetical protein